MSKKKKLTFFCVQSDAFLKDIIVDLRKDYNIKIFNRGTLEEAQNMLHDTDIAWFEWADRLLADVTRHDKFPIKYVCRLHSYEMFTDAPQHIDWNKVDKLLFVSDVVRDYTTQVFGIRNDIVETIYNGVDTEAFQIPENKKYNKKIAFIGYINYKKGPELLMQCFEKIHSIDPEFTFHIAGRHQDPRIEMYMDNFIGNSKFDIKFDGWVEPNDIPAYYADKDYVISTSLFESFQYSLTQGMSAGVLPLVHDWLGSDLIYPNQYIFHNPEECYDIIKSVEDNKDKIDEFRQEARNYIVEKYDKSIQIKAIREMLEKL